MRVFVLGIFILVVCAEVPKVFRFTNGRLIKDMDTYDSVSGTVWITKDLLVYFGMITETMTPFMTIGAPWREGVFNCVVRKFENKETPLKDLILVNKVNDKTKVSSNCSTQEGKAWFFESINNESKTMFFPPQEAGLRAKNLIGQNSEKFTSTALIYYAILDAPYIPKNDCGKEFNTYPDVDKPGPGVVILGKDGKHCAILDNEGNKFIHVNPAKRVITYDSIAIINTYFPKGFVYKAYPAEISSGLLN